MRACSARATRRVGRDNQDFFARRDGIQLHECLRFHVRVGMCVLEGKNGGGKVSEGRGG